MPALPSQKRESISAKGHKRTSPAINNLISAGKELSLPGATAELAGAHSAASRADIASAPKPFPRAHLNRYDPLS
jgi:hypothetical protein